MKSLAEGRRARHVASIASTRTAARDSGGRREVSSTGRSRVTVCGTSRRDVGRAIGGVRSISIGGPRVGDGDGEGGSTRFECRVGCCAAFDSRSDAALEVSDRPAWVGIRDSACARAQAPSCRRSAIEAARNGVSDPWKMSTSVRSSWTRRPSRANRPRIGSVPRRPVVTVPCLHRLHPARRPTGNPPRRLPRRRRGPRARVHRCERRAPRSGPIAWRFETAPCRDRRRSATPRSRSEPRSPRASSPLRRRPRSRSASSSRGDSRRSMARSGP